MKHRLFSSLLSICFALLGWSYGESSLGVIRCVSGVRGVPIGKVTASYVSLRLLGMQRHRTLRYCFVVRVSMHENVFVLFPSSPLRRHGNVP